MKFTLTICIKRLATTALIFNLGVAAIYAQQRPVKMTFSGTAAPSTVDLKQPGTNTGEEHFSGNGTLGTFTFRNISAETTTPQASSTCSPGVSPPRFYFLRVAGAGVFRFHDGSLLKVNLTQGDDCVDVVAQEGHCTMIFQISGGTGRFKNASGMLKLIETVLPALADASHSPVFFAATGQITGAVLGAAINEPFPEERQDERQE